MLWSTCHLTWTEGNGQDTCYVGCKSPHKAPHLIHLLHQNTVNAPKENISWDVCGLLSYWHQFILTVTLIIVYLMSFSSAFVSLHPLLPSVRMLWNWWISCIFFFLFTWEHAIQQMMSCSIACNQACLSWLLHVQTIIFHKWLSQKREVYSAESFCNKICNFTH